MRKLFIAGFFLLPFCTTAQTWKTYANDANHFSASYPADWTQKTKDDGLTFFTSPKENAKDNYLENVNIISRENDLFDSLKIQDILPTVTADFSSVLNKATLESKKFFTWNGQDALEIIITGFPKKNSQQKVRIVQWFCFYKKRLYTATFSRNAVTNSFADIGRKIMAGIVFKD
ncbi:MAG: PsbP-related protein [Chitinophagaceae bacterium]|nr:hypothetical protein [Chitinophagaceae bacterium]HQV06802.1 PsbP-related protein [Chitinophagaceae bacterium]